MSKRKRDSGAGAPSWSTGDALAGTHAPPTGATAVHTPPPVPSDTLTGQVLDGRYHVESRIGGGGMGVVYAAVQVSLGKRVAIKVMVPSMALDTVGVERFRREAAITAQLAHPHIVAVTDIGQTPDGRYYFVMEHLPGCDLTSFLAQETAALDPARVVRIGVQICQALQAAHDAGVLHRDLKPDNIFLTADPDEEDLVKVMDFGIAQVVAEDVALTRLTQAGTMIGSAGYMSPEQARGDALDSRTDIYSLGVVLYELLTRQLPIPGQTVSEVLSRKATDDPIPLRNFRPDVPEVLEALILRALSRDRDKRPLTMAEFAVELKAASAASLPAQVAPAPVRRSSRRSAPVAWLVAMALLALAPHQPVGRAEVAVKAVLTPPQAVAKPAPQPAPAVAPQPMVETPKPRDRGVAKKKVRRVQPVRPAPAAKQRQSEQLQEDPDVVPGKKVAPVRRSRKWR